MTHVVRRSQPNYCSRRATRKEPAVFSLGSLVNRICFLGLPNPLLEYLFLALYAPRNVHAFVRVAAMRGSETFVQISFAAAACNFLFSYDSPLE